MLDRIGERFLNDPVGGDLKPAWEPRAIATPFEMRVESGRPHLGDEYLELVETRSRGRDCIVVPGDRSQHAEQAPEFGQRLAAGPFHDQ